MKIAMAAASNVRLKLLIDTKGRKVLFAEASKDFVDFLFYLLSLPVGTVVKLLREKSMVGCLSNLYGSLENLNETYVQNNQNKNLVLNPISPLNVTEIPLFLSDHESTTRKFYTCNGYSSGHYYMADVPNLDCPYCKGKMTKEWYYVCPTAASTGTVTDGCGFVKGVVTYMIMDNLEVSPMSTISSITLLNKFNVKDLGGLEEKVANLGMNEGLKLLKASLHCKTVLTSVFLGN